ncbi:MAG: hypothetical protein O7C75_18675 [Verrucomicrobia bacterium]|nr:hypothetical protein [Verrucomicrobiota bacterium]
MRNVIQKIGFYLALAGVIVWLIGGARKGFYVVTEEIPQFDPITEIEYSDTRSKFIPGIEFLFTGLIFGGSFCLISFLFSKPLIK